MARIKDLLIVLLLLTLCFFVCSPNKKNDTANNITKIDTFYKHDTLSKYKKGDSIPFVVLDTLYLIDSMLIHDTPKMVNNYLAVKSYSDTLRINADNSVYIQDTITQNKIIGRSYKANLSEKTIVITNNIYPKFKNELLGGFIADLRTFDKKIGVGVGLNYKKKNESYTINLTTNQLSFGFYKKIF
jgi:hypothetical protein